MNHTLRSPARAALSCSLQYLTFKFDPSIVRWFTACPSPSSTVPNSITPLHLMPHPSRAPSPPIWVKRFFAVSALTQNWLRRSFSVPILRACRKSQSVCNVHREKPTASPLQRLIVSLWVKRQASWILFSPCNEAPAQIWRFDTPAASACAGRARWS